MLDDVDYRKYLSIDNGKGLLINRDDILILDRYGFDYKKYNSLSDLIFDIDNYINDSFDDIEDLEEALIRISEFHYYNETKK